MYWVLFFVAFKGVDNGKNKTGQAALKEWISAANPMG